MAEFVQKDSYDAADLMAIVALLRDPVSGCPWDKVQTHESIRMNFIEETYEVLEAISLQDSHLMCEELGDVMMQVALHCQMETEQGHFTFSDVCDGVCKKLIDRHPHIFKNPCAATSQDVLNTWDAIKNKEKGRTTLAADLQSVPAGMPALMRAAKMQKRAAVHGLSQASLPKAAESLAQQMQALQKNADDAAAAKAVVGETLFAAVQAARAVGVDAEEALEEASARFASRAICCEELAQQNGKGLEQLSESEKSALWEKAQKMQVSEGK